MEVCLPGLPLLPEAPPTLTHMCSQCLLGLLATPSDRRASALGGRGCHSHTGTTRGSNHYSCSSPGRARSIRPADAHPHPHPRVGAQPAHGVQSTLQPEPQTVSACPGARPLRLLRIMDPSGNTDQALGLSLRQHTYTDFRNVTPQPSPPLLALRCPLLLKFV